MSTPVLPVVIKGPAIVIRDSFAWYTAGNIIVKTVINKNKTPSSFHGDLGETLKSVDREITFQPAGEIKSLVKMFPYGPSNLVAAASIGNSIYTAADVPTVIHTKAGKTHTYSRTGIMKSPPLRMGPGNTLFGDMTISCISPRSALVTASATSWLAIASSAFSDTSFDGEKVIKDIYTASLGARSTPYDAMGARNGFELEFNPELAVSEDDNVGIADRHITAMIASARFAPNNLTQEQYEALLNLQDTDALLPGQFLGRGPAGVAEDLVIDSDAFTATLHAAGISAAENGFGLVDRNGMLEFTYRMTFTTGAPDPLVSLVAN